MDVGKVHFVAWGPHKKVSVNQSLLAAGFDFGEEQKDFSSALPDACARLSGRGGRVGGVGGAAAVLGEHAMLVATCLLTF